MGDSRNQWKIFRTRYLVRARQLSERQTIIASGQVIVGEPGDYLVESSDGSLRIARRDIFEDVYVRLEGTQEDANLDELATAS